MNNIINSSEMISNVVNLSIISGNELPDIWKNVVSKIKTFNDSEDCETRMPIGQRLAANTRVVDLKNGTLLIETDHPGWIQYLKIYQKFIITGLKREIKDLKINTFAFRVKGTNFGLSGSYESQLKVERKKQELDFEKQDKELEAYNKKVEQKPAKLPPELQEKVDRLYKIILTNPKD